MENGTASCTEGTLIQVQKNSDDFHTSILGPLQSSFLYEESKHCFSYESAVLIKNPALEEKYRSFRAERKDFGYSEEDLEETYGFLLFGDFNTATELGRSGLLRGTSACTTLGDPSKGVYVCKYSDCLDENRWYHGKSGYIAIIRLTKGRVKEVPENYTQDITAPTVGYDCHVSNQFPFVSARTSSFLAFERTQWYLYQLVDDGSSETARSPSQACPIAVVSFSYTDSKTELYAQLGKSTVTKMVQHYTLWRGRLQIGTQSHNVGLRSVSGVVLPAELPAVMIVDKAVSMRSLRQVLPESVFESRFSVEVVDEGLYCTLHEMVSEEETNLYPLLLQKMREKDVAFAVPLVDSGFLFLLHSNHFLTFNDTESNSNETLRGLFVFPSSRVIRREPKTEGHVSVSNEILDILPVFCQAEAELERLDIQPDEERCKVLAHHIQEYAELMNPGLTLTQGQTSNFTDQFDVPNGHKHLYSSPEWTKRKWQNFNSYISKPESFQLSVFKARELLAAGKEEAQDLEDDVYICLSSPDDSSVGPSSPGPDHELKPAKKEPTSVDELTANAQICAVEMNDFQASETNNDAHKSDPAVLNTAMLANAKDNQSSFDEPPTELIFSITSEKTVNEHNLFFPVSSEHDKLPSTSSSTKLPMGASPLNDEIVDSKRDLDIKEVMKQGVYLHPHRQGLCHKKRFHHSDIGEAVDGSFEKQMLAPSSPDTSEHKEDGDKTLESVVLRQLTACFLKRKLERWDLRPVISTCGRFLVPFGSVDEKDWKKIEKGNMQLERGDECVEKSVPVNAEDLDKEAESLNLPSEPIIEEKELISKDEGSNAHDNPESSTLRPPEDGPILCKSNLDKKEGTLSTSQEKDSRWSAAMRESLLNKLKHRIVWSKEHKKDEKAVDAPHESKKTKVDPKMSESDNTESRVTDAATSAASRNVSIDPAFAFALGLTPKESTEKMKVNEGEQTQPCEGSSRAQLQIKKMPPPIFLKRTKIKTLRKQPEVPIEHFEEKWWMHFKTSSCNDNSEKDKGSSAGQSVSNISVNNISVNNMSVSNMVLPNEANASASSDALTILADLALGATSDISPPQDEPDTSTSLKKFDVNAGDESLLHLLLKKPADRPHQPIVPQTAKLPVDTPQLGELVGREHSYSTPPHFLHLLCLPGIAFHVPLFTGESSQQQHVMPVNGMEAQPVDECKEKCNVKEDDQSTDFGRKSTVRHFVKNGTSVKITRQWEENYDFNYDSRFTCEPKDRAIIRALHGPWDISFQDTSEEMRLVVHMWIALFYSRSTDRFFQVDPTLLNPCSGDSAALENPSEASDAFQTETKAKACASALGVDTSEPSKSVDLRNEDLSPVVTRRDLESSDVMEASIVKPKETDVSEEEKELGDMPAVERDSASTLQSSSKAANEIDDKEENARTSQEDNRIRNVGTQVTVHDGRTSLKVEPPEMTPEQDQDAGNTVPIDGFNVEDNGVTKSSGHDPKILQMEASKLRIDMDRETVNEKATSSQSFLNINETHQKVILGIDADTSRANQHSLEDKKLEIRPENTKISLCTSETGQEVPVKRKSDSRSATPEPEEDSDKYLSPGSRPSALTPPVEDKLPPKTILGDVLEVKNQSNLWPNFHPDARTHRVLQSLESILLHSQLKAERNPISYINNRRTSSSSAAVDKHSHHQRQTSDSKDLHETKNGLLDCLHGSHLNSATDEEPDLHVQVKKANLSVQPFDLGCVVQDHLHSKTNKQNKEQDGHNLKTEVIDHHASRMGLTMVDNKEERVWQEELKRNFISTVCESEEPKIAAVNMTISSITLETTIGNSEIGHSVQALEGCNVLSVTRELSIEEGETYSSDSSFSGHVTESADVNGEAAEDFESSHHNAESPANQSQDSLKCTVSNTNTKPPPSFLEHLSNRCLQNDPTQASVDQECLIFSEKMKLLLKSSTKRLAKQMKAHENIKWPFVSANISNPIKLETTVEVMEASPGIENTKLEISVEKIEKTNKRNAPTEEVRASKKQKVAEDQELDVGVSAVTTECAMLYTTVMDNVCSGKMVPPGQHELQTDKVKPEENDSFEPCHMKRQLDESYKNKVNSLVKKSCKSEFRFYILVTSEDSFFEKTKTLLEAEGHFPEHPSHFLQDKDNTSALFVILRNEDIAEHICEVPHLLELKQSTNVRFAGIDEPDDVVNLTYRELFLRGGFIMVDRAALDSLSLCQIRRITEILKELSKSGKWKWILHYRIRHRLNVNARSNAESKEKKHLLDECEEAGLLEVLPHHDCDLKSRDEPDYAACLAKLQIQNISARFSVFLSDVTPVGETWSGSGILRMTVESFLIVSSTQMLRG